ncbi:MAG: ABC transporter permease [Oscillospiraceae bacterium]|nr:ABC transporter permease [Oscillospiraceae bacterium]
MEETAKSGTDIKGLIKSLPPAPFIIGGFWVLVLIVAAILNMPWVWLISDSLQRAAIWGMLVLAMVPSIQSGTGPNFALPVGLCGGMLAMVTAIQLGFTGMGLLVMAAGMAAILGIIMGYLYGVLMNAVKGSEMAIATYTGFSITAVFFIIWLAVPFDNPFLGWFIGEGLRNTIALGPMAANQVLDNFLMFEVIGLTIRTGTILVFAVFCTLVWLFFRSKTGIAISAVGANPMFARAAGLNVDRSRIIANIISTSLAAVGVVVYAQSFGFLQLYDFPMWMAFPAVAAVLVGGATAQRAKVIHVVIGVILFQGLLTTVPPVFTEILAGADMTDAARMVIQNAIILYALTKIRGGGK